MAGEPARRVDVPEPPDGGVWVVAAAGVALAALGTVHIAVSGFPPGASAAGFEVFTGVLVPLLAGGLVLFASRTDGVQSGHRRRGPLVRWTFLGILVLCLLAVWASVDELLAGEVVSVVGTLVLGANLGILLGAVAGINRAQAMRNAELAERERTQREGLEFLNHLLGHHVRNGMTIIDGYTSELREQGVDGDHVAVIERQSTRIVTLVENVQTLVESISGDVDKRAIDVADVAERAVTDARQTHPDVTVELDARPATARADEFVRALFDNLLSNAVEHHDRDEPTVRVVVREAPDRVIVRVVDDGPGVPEGVRRSFADTDDLTTAISGDGLGLYIVYTLVQNYDGSVRIEDRTPHGTVVTVTLPRP
jgi:signal transduction histidine kinase